MTDKFGTQMTNIEWLTDQAAKLRISANPCAGETPLTAMADRFDRTATEITRLRAALRKVADLIDSEAGEPLDDAIEIATKALQIT